MFVSEKSVSKPIEITIDTEQRLALQREIDQQSQPTQLLKPLTSTTVGVATLVEMKMEDNNCEENLISKKKRKQKDLKSKHENKNYTADVRKEKKWKKVDTVAKEEKKKKWKLDSNSVSDVTDKENGVKKKKKQLLSDDNQLQNIDNYVKEENLEKKEQEKETGKKIPKKAKKIKKDILTVSTETGDHIKEKKKKKEQPVTETKTKKKLKVEENEIKLEEAEVEKVKLKKKTKKEVKTEKFDNGLDATEIKSKKKKETKEKKNLKRKAVDEDETHINKTNILTQSEKGTEEGKAKVKKKNKKEKCRKISVEDVIEVMEPKKKKKKRSKDVESSKKDVSVAADTQKKSKKNKTSVEVKREFDTAVEAGAKKRKKIKEHKDFLEEQQDDFQFSKVDVVFLSQRSGNADEININQERRKALQMEIDEASQPQNPTTPKGLGQWSTAQFDSSEQQQKFLRLMGGFKKGFQPAVETSGGGSMAKGKNAQQQLQQGLLGEFERAHSRRMDFNYKGAGLGFTAPSNKKFSIDISACRSVRFDD